MHIRSSLKHYWQVRPRLLFSVGAGLLCFLLLPAQLSLLQRLMIGWNTLAWLYLLFLWRLMLISTPQHIRQIARRQDESASMVLTLVSLGCLVSLLAILFELGSAKQVAGSLKTLHLLLTGATLVVSWLLLPTAFTMHYAHQFYRQGAQQDPCRCCSPATSPSRPIWISPTSPSPLRWRRKPPMWRSGRRRYGRSPCCSR